MLPEPEQESLADAENGSENILRISQYLAKTWTKDSQCTCLTPKKFLIWCNLDNVLYPATRALSVPASSAPAERRVVSSQTALS